MIECAPIECTELKSVHSRITHAIEFSGENHLT